MCCTVSREGGTDAPVAYSLVQVGENGRDSTLPWTGEPSAGLLASGLLALAAETCRSQYRR